MKLEQDILFAKIFEKPTILICGEEEEMDGYALNKLLQAFTEKGRAVQKVFFSDANSACRNYLKSSPLVEGQDFFLEMEDVSIRAALQTPLSRGYNLMVCGFPQQPDQRLFHILNGLPVDPGSPYLFFSSKPSKDTISFWQEERNAYVNPQGIGLAGLIKLQSPDVIQFERVEESFKHSLIPDLRRLPEKLHDEFLDSGNGVCQVIGMPGVGKRTFIKELIQKGKISNPLFFSLGDRSPIIDVVLESLKLGRGIPSTSAPNADLDAIISRIKDRTESLSLISFVLFDTEKVLDDKDRITDEDLLSFFTRLAKASPKVKLYLVSSREIILGDDGNIKSNFLYIDPFDAHSIAKIVQKAYSSAISHIQIPAGQLESESRLAVDPQKILRLTGGHPGIAETIVTRFKTLPLNEWAEDPALEQDILELRNDYVRKILDVNEEDEDLLEFLSLFDEDFEYDAIKELHPHPARMVNRLSRKRLLTSKFDRGTNWYSLPVLIKEYFQSDMKEKDKRIYKDRIARYYKYKSGY